MKKSKKVLITKDIKIKLRTLEDLYNIGYIKKRDEDKMDVSMIISPYFHKMPSVLKINEKTDIGTKIWTAKDFYDGKRKKFFYIKQHKAPSGRDLVGYATVYNEDEKTSEICFYDEMCKVPENHKTHNKKTIDELATEYKEKKKIIKNEKESIINKKENNVKPRKSRSSTKINKRR
jgi:hypothetical protein